MFAIKTRARYLTHGVKLKALLLALLPAAAGVSAGSCLLSGALGLVFGAQALDTPFGALLAKHPWARAALPWTLLGCGGLFLLWFFALKFTLRAFFYYRTDRNQSRPQSFISLKSGLRALGCEAAVFIRRAGWLALLEAPGAATLTGLWLLLKNAGLSPALLWAGLGLGLGQLAAGAAGAYILRQRYFLAPYLMYLNPLLSPKEAVRSGVLLTKGRLLFCAACRFSALPWRALALLGAARPFAFSYVRLIDAVLSETLFAEDKRKINAPAAVFYVDKTSRFRLRGADG